MRNGQRHVMTLSAALLAGAASMAMAQSASACEMHSASLSTQTTAPIQMAQNNSKAVDRKVDQTGGGSVDSQTSAGGGRGPIEHNSTTSRGTTGSGMMKDNTNGMGSGMSGHENSKAHDRKVNQTGTETPGPGNTR